MDPTENFAGVTERIEIRILGPLRVRRADGSVVAPAEWRTSQTADLLRLLALRVDEPVPVEQLLDALWPLVDEARGRASLRTAASCIRKVLGEDCVQRRFGGLVLTGAWVDAHAFRTLAHLARRHVVTGALARAVTTTREADALYRGDFRAHHDVAEWGTRERESLAATFRTMIADAAEAAAALGWWHDAVDLAQRTLAVDSCSERGFRALMRAERGMGESSRALRTYDRCRRLIADEVGADPSPQTQSLYLEILADAPVVLAPTPFGGRVDEQDWLHELAETSAATREPALVCVLGPAGAGKTRLIERSFAASGSPLATIICTPDTDPWPAVVEAIGAELSRPQREERIVLVPRHGPVTVVLDDAHLLSTPVIDRLAGHLASLRGPVCVALAARPASADGQAEQLVRALGGHARLLTLQPLAAEDVATLCAALLQGKASNELVSEVVARTDGSPGAVIALVREWTATGRVASTSSGLVVLHPDFADGTGTPVRGLMSEAVETLSAGAMELLQLAVILGRPVSAELLGPLTGHLMAGDVAADESWLRATLDQLTDLALLTPVEAGFAPSDPLLADLIVTWLRPSTRRRLHRRIAELAQVPAAERAEHWRRAGEPHLARAAELAAADDAFDGLDYEAARVHLRELCRTSEGSEATPADRIELYERWGDAATALGRTHEARAAFAAGASLARAHRLPDRSRLQDKSEQVVDTRAASVGQAYARPELAASPEAGPWTDRDEVELGLHRAVQEADSGGDPEQRALARARLVREVCIPQRQLRAARRWSVQALSLTVNPRVCAQALVAAWFGGAVLGEAASAEDALGRATALLGDDDDDVADHAALQCLAAHDLGRDQFPELYAAAAALGCLADPRRHQWAAIRIATERRDFAAATLADLLPTPADVRPVIRQLRGCASAALAMQVGQPDCAHGLLLDVLEIAATTGATLLVPEAVARLIVLEAPVDLVGARRRFEQFDDAVGRETWFPRENVLKMIARASIRAADDRPDEAASAAAAAADEAERAGLVHLAADSHRYRAIHLAAAGRAYEARLATNAAKRWLSSARPIDDALSTFSDDAFELARPYGTPLPLLPAPAGEPNESDEAPAV